MADNGIPQPVTSGATDQPNAPQSGNPQVVPAPEGLSETPPQGPPPPEGLSETPPEQKKPEEVDELKYSPDVKIMKGMAKGAGQTVSTLGHLGSDALKYGSQYTMGLGAQNPISMKIDQGLKILDTATTPKGALEKSGVLLEGLGEFFIGDEALKSVSMADRLGIAQKVMDIGQKYPMFAKLLGHGLQAIRQGTTAGVQSKLHGATNEEALNTAEGGALFGTAAGAAGDVISAGVGKAGSMIKGVLDTSKRTTQELQPEFQQGIRDVVDQVATEEKVPTGKAASIRDHVGEVAENVEDKAVKMLQEVDKASGEPFVQKFRQRLSNIRRELNSLPEAGGGPREAELEAEKDGVEKDMEEALQRAEAQGVPRKQLDDGLQLFKKAQALYDLDSVVKRPAITKGLQPNLGTAAQAAANPETVRASALADRLQTLYGKGRLQEALGDDRAKNLLLHVYDTMADETALNKAALHAQGTIKTAKRVGAGAVGAVGAGSLLGAGALVHSVMSGQ